MGNKSQAHNRQIQWTSGGLNERKKLVSCTILALTIVAVLVCGMLGGRPSTLAMVAAIGGGFWMIHDVTALP